MERERLRWYASKIHNLRTIDARGTCTVLPTSPPPLAASSGSEVSSRKEERRRERREKKTLEYPIKMCRSTLSLPVKAMALWDAPIPGSPPIAEPRVAVRDTSATERTVSSGGYSWREKGFFLESSASGERLLCYRRDGRVLSPFVTGSRPRNEMKFKKKKYLRSNPYASPPTGSGGVKTDVRCPVCTNLY